MVELILFLRNGTTKKVIHLSLDQAMANVEYLDVVFYRAHQVWGVPQPTREARRW